MKGSSAPNWPPHGLRGERAGYQALRKIVESKMTPDAVVAEVKKSALRAVAARAFHRLKWSFMPKNFTGQKYIVCNSDEASRARSRTATSSATTRTSSSRG
jgi:NADH-quinone oxidoreductase subunit F